jgi:hypothetical protein
MMRTAELPSLIAAIGPLQPCGVQARETKRPKTAIRRGINGMQRVCGWFKEVREVRKSRAF